MLNLFHALWLYVTVSWTKIRFPWRAKFRFIRKLTPRQLFEEKQRERYLFHSMLKEGDQYRLGEATVTLAKFGIEGKQEVAAKIAAADARRKARMDAQTEKAIDIMLMTPEQLLDFRIGEWTEKRKKYSEAFQKFGVTPKEERRESVRAETPPPKDQNAP